MRQVSVTGGPESGLVEIRDTKTGEFVLDYRKLLFFVEAGGSIVATAEVGKVDLEAGEIVPEVCGVDIRELDIEAVLVHRGDFKKVVEG